MTLTKETIEGWRHTLCGAEQTEELDEIFNLALEALASRGNVVVPREAMQFLFGEAPLQGVEFGDTHPTIAGKYWWRSVIRAMISATEPRG